MPEREIAYRFDRFLLDIRRGTLSGPDGTALRLRPKSFALLQYLVERSGQLFGREELLRILWPNVAVTDDSLTQCIGDLRRAFGDRAGEILRTMPRRGYMLTAAVTRELMSSDADTLLSSALVTGPDLPLLRRDAVLVQQLQMLSCDDAERRLAQLLIAELTAELVRYDDLRIISGKVALSGGYRLGGEVHAASSELRISLWLDDVISGTVFWAERISLSTVRGFSIPAEAIAALAVTIDLQIDRESLRRARAKPLENLTARELCLLGRERHQHGTERDTEDAQKLFARSAALDPGYAAAQAWHAFTLMRTVTYGWPGHDENRARAVALKLSRRAVELEPDSSLCLAALAFSLALCEHWEEAVESARAALRSHRLTHGMRTACGEVLAAGGQADEAVSVLREAIARDPQGSPRTYAILGRALLLAGRSENALEELRRCAARLPDYAPCFRTMVVAAYETGEVTAACVALRDVARLQPNWLPGEKAIFWFLRKHEDIARFQNAFQAVQRLDAAAMSGRLGASSRGRWTG